MTSASYDLVLEGGHVVCPALSTDDIIDVAVSNGRIAAVAEDILPSTAKQVISAHDMRRNTSLPRDTMR